MKVLAPRILWHLALAVLLVTSGTAQNRKQTKRRPPTSRHPLTAREIARRSLPSVVVLISRVANGKAVTLGSGFFVTSRIIATNQHVIKDASRVTARLLNGNKNEYEINGSVAIDEENDLALLQIETGVEPDLERYLDPVAKPLPLAKSNRTQIGDEVYVVGNPEGLEGTFSQGIISAFRGTDYIQLTAPISHGSSGGPVLNKYGEVIGVAVGAIEEGQNLNFAIPVSKLAQLMNRKNDNVTRLTPSMPSTAGSEWQLVASGNGEDYYFNRDRITQTLEHTFLVWIKSVPTESQEGRVVRKGLIDLLDAAKVIRAYDVSYRMQQLEFDCGRQRIRHLDDAYYDKEGELLHRVNIFSLPEDIRIQMTGWDSVLPESVGEAQLNFVCKVN